MYSIETIRQRLTEGNVILQRSKISIFNHLFECSSLETILAEIIFFDGVI